MHHETIVDSEIMENDIEVGDELCYTNEMPITSMDIPTAPTTSSSMQDHWQKISSMHVNHQP